MGEKTTRKAKVCELQCVNINGDNQWIHIQGESIENPIILFLHGGPGFSQMSFAPALHFSLAQDCLTINWDQRASGKSFSRHSDYSKLSLETYVSDTIELSKWLLSRFHQNKLFLVGHSWGCTLGMYAVQRCPQLYYAFIGTGFGVYFNEGEKLSVKYLFARATEANDTKTLEKLQCIEFPIPPEKFEPYIELKSRLMNRYGGYFFTNPLALLPKVLPSLLFSRVYSVSDYWKMMQGIRLGKETAKNILPSINFFDQIPRIDTSIHFFIGRHDYHTPFELARRYYDSLIAEKKGWVWFERSAHSPLFEESEAFCRSLFNVVKTEDIPQEGGISRP